MWRKQQTFLKLKIYVELLSKAITITFDMIMITIQEETLQSLK